MSLAAPDRHHPIIIVTARGDPIDRVIGLEIGADDYLAKPFEPRELLARIRSVLRRTAAIPLGEPVALSDSAGVRFGGWNSRSPSPPPGRCAGDHRAPCR